MQQRSTIPTLAAALTPLLLGACAAVEPPTSTTDRDVDLVLRGGTVYDGRGGSPVVADVAIRGDRIVRVERRTEGPEPTRDADASSASSPPSGDVSARSRLDADRTLDVDGLVVAPGFIDNHAHVQTTIHRHPLAENFTRQGITTILASLHSGDQPWPLDEYAASLEVAPNVGFFAGHTWTRKQVLGLDDRAPTPDELEAMVRLVDETMRQGALGLSTGLLYVPANYATTEEVIELARVAARHGGIYVTHMRNEASGLLDSVAETIRIAREAGIPAQIQHHKAVGPPQWGWSERSLAMIDEARAEGLDVKHDLYPYTASSTGSSVLFPQWALAGGDEAFAARIADPETRARIEAEMREIWRVDRVGDDLRRVQFRTVPSAPEYDGRTLADMAADLGLPDDLDSGIRLVIELQLAGGFSAIYHSMDEADLIRILRHPWSMIETDGDPVGYGVGFPHPRSYGAFPRVLARYVRELGVIGLEEAVHKMTAMAADQIGQPDRGRIAEGKLADIVVFDPDTIADRATFTDPHQYSLGVRHLIVNGVPVILDGAFTGARPGRVLRGPARPDATEGSQG